jgi:hypothetical protein
VEEFAKEGAKVAIFDFNEINGKQAEDKLRAQGLQVTFFKGNSHSFFCELETEK